MRRSADLLLKGVIVVLGLFAVLVGGALGTGRLAIVATHGVSMNPVYYQGDLVVVEKADSYHVGEIVAYRVPAKGLTVLHRIIGGDNTAGFEMKGDNNQSVDPFSPTAAASTGQHANSLKPASQVIGHAVLHLSHVGRLLNFLTSPTVLGLVALGLISLGGNTIRIRNRRRRRQRSAAVAGNVSTSPSTGPAKSVLAMPRPLQMFMAITAGLAVLGLALGAFAFKAPLDRLASATAPAAAQMDFSYTATVPLTAAYDGTTVRSPDPVFRKLTDVVDMQMAYHGSPGSMTVSAELSNAGGWHSTVLLGKPTSFTGDDFKSTVRLDLTALDARAQAAAAVTGIPTSQLTVTLTPVVSTADGGVFSPKLAMTLAPLQLALSGDPSTLTVKDAVTASSSTSVPNTIGVFGRSMSVSKARTLSELMLLIAVFAVAAVALVVRRTPAVHEGALIRRRYAPLLASVDPMSTPPDLPVIDVADFATLAKMADRYGLLVLHWSRSDVETFIVLEEGTTYRYRIGGGHAARPHTAAPVPRFGNGDSGRHQLDTR